MLATATANMTSDTSAPYTRDQIKKDDIDSISFLPKKSITGRTARLSFMARNMESRLVFHLGPSPLQQIDYIHNSAALMSKQLASSVKMGVSEHLGRAFLASKGIDLSKIDLLLQQLKDFASEKIVTKHPQSHAPKEAGLPLLDLNCYFERDLEDFREHVLDIEKDKLSRRVIDVSSSSLRQDWKKFISSFVTKQITSQPVDISKPSLIAQEVAITGRKGPDPKANAYANVIVLFNEYRLKKSFFALCEKFAEVTTKLGSQTGISSATMNHMTDIWKLISTLTEEKSRLEDHMVDIDKLRANNIDALKQPGDAPLHIRMRKTIMKNSISYLCKYYIHFMDKMILQFPKEAKLGGKPSILNKVRAYLNIKYGKATNEQVMETAQGVPIWPAIFYLLRCGDIEGLVAFVSQYETWIRRSDARFLEVVKSLSQDSGYCIKSADLRNHVIREFSNLRKNESTQDQFHILVYAVLGKYAGTDEDFYYPSTILMTMEDWLWYQLCLIQEDGRSTDRSLEKLQGTIMELGPEYFKQKNDPLYYVKVCLLSGLYEHAIKYLSTSTSETSLDWICEAVHICIALMYNGLMKLDSDSVSFISSLLERYWSKFMKTSPQVSLHYILSLSLLGDDQLVMTSIKDWVLGTKEYTFAFGQCSLDGATTPGYLDKWSFLIHEADPNVSLASMVALEAARQAESEGNYDDAVMLFHTGGDYQRVLLLLYQQISDGLILPLSVAVSELSEDAKNKDPSHQFCISLDTTTMNRLEVLISQVHAIIGYYNKQLTDSEWMMKSNTYISLASRINVLTSIYEILKAVGERRWYAAINALTSCQLFTFEEGIVHEGIWKISDAILAKHIPSMFVLSMKAISGAFHEEKEGASKANRDEYRRMSRQLMVALGRCVALRMPSDIYAIMNQYDASMNY